jgi:hypothetical protein
MLNHFDHVIGFAFSVTDQQYFLGSGDRVGNRFKDFNIVFAWTLFNIVETFAGMQMAFVVLGGVNALGS